MEKSIKENVTFSLPNKIITVKHISRKKGMASNVGEDHVISGGMLTGSVRKYQAPLLRNGSLANVLTTSEKEYLEKETGLELSVYKDFWTTHFVSLFKEDNRLDLSNPMDYISYKILLANKDDIASSWSERSKKLTYDFVIVESDEELIERKVSFDAKKEAFKLYGKIEDDKNKLIGILTLLNNKPISKDSSLAWLQVEIEKIIDKKPESFVSLIKDTSLDTKLLLNEAVTNGYVKKSGNKYSTVDGLELCENSQVPTFENAVKYLDNIKHQDVKSLIEAKLLKDK